MPCVVNCNFKQYSTKDVKICCATRLINIYTVASPNSFEFSVEVITNYRMSEQVHTGDYMYLPGVMALE